MFANSHFELIVVCSSIARISLAQAALSILFVPGDGIGIDGPWPYISLPIGE